MTATSGVSRPTPTQQMFLLLLLLILALALGPASGQVSVHSYFDKTPKLPEGVSVSFVCEVTNKDASLSVRMLCPLAKVAGTSCFENCNRICVDSTVCVEEPRMLRISCSLSASGGKQVYTYHMSSLDPTFTGSWSCRHMLIDSTPVQLSVYPSPSIQAASFSASTVVESQTAVATCSAAPAAIGSLRFSWARADGLTIPHANSALNATTTRLVVDNARRTDEAVYVCTVENEVGAQAARQLPLTVNYPPASVRLTASLASPQQAGVSVTFTCQVDGGKPDPVKRYYRERPGQARVEIVATVTLDAADNTAKFYCKAESVGIIGIEMWSSAITFSVFFPPSGFSPGSRFSAGQQEVPLFPYYHHHQHQNVYQQHPQMMLTSAASRHRLNGTSNGSLNSQHQQQNQHQLHHQHQYQLQHQLQHQFQHQFQHQHQRILTPDLVQTETAIGGPSDLVRYNSRVSLASSRSGFSPIAAPPSGPHSIPLPSPGPFAAAGITAPPPQSSESSQSCQPLSSAFVFPNIAIKQVNGSGGGGANGGAGGDSAHSRFAHALSDSGCGYLGLQPTYVATPLSPHMESNMEAIENYV